MSRHGDITLPWADGEYTFRLAIGEMRKLQERTDAGPYELLKRLAVGAWRIDDVRETIRLGLQGGSKEGHPNDILINRLIRDYVDEKPLLSSVSVAARILEAVLTEPADDPIPKSQAAEAVATRPSEVSSPSPPSTDGAQFSDTPPGKSTRSHSGSSGRARLAI